MNPEFKQTFIRLGLEQYLPIFIRSGFGDWHLLCNITESDFALLGVNSDIAGNYNGKSPGDIYGQIMTLFQQTE
jgi:hypothetical protein